MTAVMMPPVRNEMYFGARFEKSNEGETTFAAMFVEIWAITMTIMARIRSAGMPPASLRDELDGVPDRLAEDHDGRRRDRDPDKREGRHREREARWPVR